MTYKQIEQSREVRLWIKEIIIPSVIVGGMICYTLREPLREKFSAVKNRIRDYRK